MEGAFGCRDEGRDVVTAVAAVLIAAVSAALVVVAVHALALQLYAQWTPSTLDGVGARTPRPPQRSFSLIVPARDELGVLMHTLRRLDALDHPSFEVLVVVSGDDDEATRALAEDAERAIDRVRVVHVFGPGKNKPKALNAALTYCAGDVVGVIDAESLVAPELLAYVDSRFVETGADIVQSGVQLMNYETSWWSLQNCLEYFFWFRSRLHYQAARSFITLGGNTVFFSRAKLLEHNGWDESCLAEDCEIGVRLSVAGATTSVLYEPSLVTREETPSTVKALIKQRVRWMQGFLQTFRKGEWRALPTRGQRLLAGYTLAMPVVQAATGVFAPLAIVVAIALKTPTPVALFSFLPLLVIIATTAVYALVLAEFSAMYDRPAKLRHYLALVLGMIPYQLLLSVAAVWALVRYLRGDNRWDKTAHAGRHLELVLEGAQ